MKETTFLGASKLARAASRVRTFRVGGVADLCCRQSGAGLGVVCCVVSENVDQVLLNSTQPMMWRKGIRLLKKKFFEGHAQGVSPFPRRKTSMSCEPWRGPCWSPSWLAAGMEKVLEGQRTRGRRSSFLRNAISWTVSQFLNKQLSAKIGSTKRVGSRDSVVFTFDQAGDKSNPKKRRFCQNSFKKSQKSPLCE